MEIHKFSKKNLFIVTRRRCKLGMINTVGESLGNFEKRQYIVDKNYNFISINRITWLVVRKLSIHLVDKYDWQRH